VAAESGSEECVRLLVSAGADKAARTGDGHQPWHLAVNSRLARLLLPDGLDAKERVHVAAAVGDEAALRALLSAKPAAARERDERGYTALHYAAKNGEAACVRVALDAGSDKDARTHGLETPLHFAALNGHAECVALLLRTGAEIQAKLDSGESPLHCASSAGHAECVALLLRAGADTNARDKDEWTALHFCAWNGHAECAELLLRAGADREARRSDGWTPLHVAARGGHGHCVEALVRAGADLGATSNDGWMPLHIATRHAHFACVRLLLRAGADPTARITSVEHRYGYNDSGATWAHTRWSARKWLRFIGRAAGAPRETRAPPPCRTEPPRRG
jgi:cytohesin